MKKLLFYILFVLPTLSITTGGKSRLDKWDEAKQEVRKDATEEVKEYIDRTERGIKYLQEEERLWKLRRQQAKTEQEQEFQKILDNNPSCPFLRKHAGRICFWGFNAVSCAFAGIFVSRLPTDEYNNFLLHKKHGIFQEKYILTTSLFALLSMGKCTEACYEYYQDVKAFERYKGKQKP